ncbi:MAG: hypothetical protein ABIG28_00975 [archaeon]
MEKEGLTRQTLLVAGVVVLLLISVIFISSSRNEEAFFSPELNAPPKLAQIDEEIFVCEGSALSHTINARDTEEDSIEFDIYPKYKDPFFIRKTSSTEEIISAELYSADLTKSEAGKTYREMVFVSDGQFADSANTEVTVIEINNPPQIEKIGAHTILVGQTFFKQFFAEDEESAELSFTREFISGEELFDISSTGTVEFAPDDSQTGNYRVNICVTDEKLPSPHQKINLCNQDGSSQTACEEFQLTIVEKNRPPTISSSTPEKKEITVSGNEKINFKITNFDPDETIPDASWYVDKSLIASNSNKETNEFTHTFDCSEGGAHTVRAEITDGLLTDSVQWNINVKSAGCLVSKPKYCEEKWACYDWDVCQNTELSFKEKKFTDEDYQNIKEECSQSNWGNDDCGVKVRQCFDLNNCGTFSNKLREISACYFVLSPSCSDKIRNCHDGGCEFLTDCGGPCADCPTCSDKTKNQDEDGIDCGGPCLNQCPEQIPLIKKTSTKYIMYSIFILAMAIVAILVIRIIKMKKELETFKEKNEKNK